MNAVLKHFVGFRYKSIYIEKSPPNVARFPFLQNMFKDARKVLFLAIMKNPLSLFLSEVCSI